MAEQGPTTTIRTKGDSYKFTKFTRRQDVVEVNKRELEEIAELDWSCQSQMLIGQLLIGGGAGLLLEKLVERDASEPFWTPVFSISLGGASVGIILLAYGVLSWRIKAKRIKAIFQEMEEQQATE